MVQNLSVERKAQLKKAFQEIVQIAKTGCFSKRFWIFVIILYFIGIGGLVVSGNYVISQQFNIKLLEWNYIYYEEWKKVWQLNVLREILVLWFVVSLMLSFLVLFLFNLFRKEKEQVK